MLRTNHVTAVLLLAVGLCTMVTTLAAAADPSAPRYGGILKIITRPGVGNLGYPGGAYLPGDGLFGDPAVESLFKQDEKGNVSPGLCSSWKISPDYKSITLNLRKGVKFHDGTDFNAEAAKVNLDMLMKGVRPTFKPVTSIDIIDDYTLRLNVSSYSAAFVFNCLGSAAMMASPAAIKTLGKDLHLHPVGTGPFRFVSYQADVSLKYSRFEKYWQKGKPYVDGIEFRFIADPVTSLASFQTGEAQVIQGAGAKEATDFMATGKYNINTAPSIVCGLAGDSAHADSPFSNIKVRQAVAYAIDNATVAKAVGYGLYPVTNQFSGAIGPAYNPKVIGYPYNPAKAKQLLAEAGYPTGFKTKLSYQATPVLYQDIFAAVQGYLKAVNIDAALEPLGANAMTDMTRKGWNNGLVWFHMPYSTQMDPGNAFSLRLQGQMFTPKSLWLPSEVDSLISKANTSPNAKERAILLKEIQKMMVDKYCMAIPICVTTNTLLLTKEVHDCNYYRGGATTWNPENVWLSK